MDVTFTWGFGAPLIFCCCWLLVLLNNINSAFSFRIDFVGRFRLFFGSNRITKSTWMLALSNLILLILLKMSRMTFLYFHLILQLVLFNLPLTLYLAYFLDINNRPAINKTFGKISPRRLLGNLLSFLRKSLGHFVFVALLVWQASSCYNLLYTYGQMAFLLSPAKTWSVVLTVYLFWKVHRPKQREFTCSYWVGSIQY